MYYTNKQHYYTTLGQVLDSVLHFEPLLDHWHICSWEQSPYSIIGELHPASSLHVRVRDVTHLDMFLD